MLSKKNKMILTSLLTVLLGGVGAGVWWLMQSPTVIPNSGSASEKKPSVPDVMTPKGKVEERKESHPLVSESQFTPKALESAPQLSEIPLTVPVSGNLAKLTALQNQLYELELHVAIADRQAKIRKSESETLETLPVVTAPLPLTVPELTEKMPSRSRENRVVSVQGVAGKLSTTIRSASGALVTVSQGGRFADGVVEISRSGVLIRSGRATRTLSFE